MNKLCNIDDIQQIEAAGFEAHRSERTPYGILALPEIGHQKQLRYGSSALDAGVGLIIPGRQGMQNQAFVQTIWQQVEAYGITVIAGVPTVMSVVRIFGADGRVI